MTEDDELEGRRTTVRAAVFAGIAHRRTLRRRLTVAAISGASLAVAAGTALGATHVYVPESPPDIRHSLVCYSSEDLSLPQGVLTVEVLTDQSARDACADLVGYPPDQLALCVADGGVRAVLPNPRRETDHRVCDRVGLPVWKG